MKNWIKGAIGATIVAAAIGIGNAGVFDSNGDVLLTSNCMGTYGDSGTPHLCGWPDQTNTGTLPGVSRDNVGTSVTLSTNGQVYENKTVAGSITVEANNVTIRNVKVTGQIYINFGSTYTGLLIEDTEVDMNGNLDTRGILYGNYTARRVFIHNGSDCAQMDFNVVIEDSFCAVGEDTNGDGWVDDESAFCAAAAAADLHLDGFQSDGGSNYVLDHNTIRNPCGSVSTILMSSNVGAISTVQISNNLVGGGGYTIYCAASGNAISGTNSFTGNRFSKIWYPNGGEFGATTDCGSATGYGTISGNVWDNDNTPIP